MCPHRGIKTAVSNFRGPSSKILEPKNFVFNYAICDVIVNISALEQDIVDWKTTLQTVITAVYG